MSHGQQHQVLGRELAQTTAEAGVLIELGHVIGTAGVG